MDHLYDYKKFAILYVDDEENSLKSFLRAFGDQFRIFTAPNALEGLKLLQEHSDEIGLLMTDQRMPGEKGVWLLENAPPAQPAHHPCPGHRLRRHGRCHRCRQHPPFISTSASRGTRPSLSPP